MPIFSADRTDAESVAADAAVVRSSDRRDVAAPGLGGRASAGAARLEMMPGWLDDWLEKTRLTHARPARYRPTIRVKNVIAAFGASAVAATAHAFGETTDGPVRIFAAAVEFVVLAALAVGMVQAARDHG